MERNHSNGLTNDEIESLLKGKTQQVYFYMLRHLRPMGMREIQRGSGLSSPSLAIYHLNKLKNLSLIDVDDDGNYYVIQEFKAGLLRFFAGSGRFLVPRYFFYSVFYTVVLIGVLISIPPFLNSAGLLLIAVLLFATFTSWRETLNVWRVKI